MPITASMGALSYTRTSITVDYWYLQFTDPVVLTNIVNDEKKLYLTTTSGLTQDEYVGLIRIDTNINPRITWEKQIARQWPSYSTTATQTNTTFDYITVASNSGFTVGDPIRFSGTVFGGVVANTTYYVLSKVSTDRITISLNRGGTRFNTGNATGSMTVSIYYNINPGVSYPPINSLSTKINSFNSKIDFCGGLYDVQISPTTNRSVGIFGYVASFDTNGSNFTIKDATSNNMIWIGEPNIWTLDVTPLNSTDYFTINSRQMPAGANNSANTLQVTTFARYNSGVQVYEKQFQGPLANLQATSYEGFSGLDNNNNIITVNQHSDLTNTHGRAGWNQLVQKFNPTTGNVTWTSTLYIQDVPTPTNEWPQNLSGAVNDVPGNATYVITREERLIPPTNTRGGFIFKFNNNGLILWQKHINEFQPIKVCVDVSNNVYIVGQNYQSGGAGPGDIYLTKFDSNGNLLWSNILTDTTDQFNLRAADITVYDGDMYIAGNLYPYNTGVPIGGMLFKLPADGSIPGSGTYPISNNVVTYPLTYASVSLTISNSNVLNSRTSFQTLTSTASVLAIPTTANTSNKDPYALTVIV